MTPALEWLADHWDPVQVVAGLAVLVVGAVLARASSWAWHQVQQRVSRTPDAWSPRARIGRWRTTRHRRRLFVNRTQALEACRRAVRSDRPSVVVIHGEVGRGTSALVELVLAEASRHATTVWVDVRDLPTLDDVAFEIGRQLRRAGHETPSLDEEDRVAARARDLTGAVQRQRPSARSDALDEERYPRASRLVTNSLIQQTLGAHHLDRTHQRRQALVADLRRAKALRPVVVGLDGVDDLMAPQWLAERLEGLLVAVEEHATVLVATHEATPAIWQHRGWESITLRPLTNDERTKLVRRRLRIEYSRRTSRSTAQRIAVGAGDRAVDLVTAAGRFALLAPERDGPETAGGSTTSALDALTDREHSALRELSALAWFTADIVATVCHTDPAFTEHLLRHPLVASSGLVARVHDAVRGELRTELEGDPERAADLHRRAATAFAEIVADTPAEATNSTAYQRARTALCHHRLRCMPLPEAQATVGAAVADAIDHQEAELAAALIDEVAAVAGSDDPWVRAWRAEFALLRGEHTRALQLLRPLELDRHDLDRLGATALLARARARYHTGRYAEAGGDLERAIARFLALEVAEPQIAYAEEQLAKVRRMQGDLTTALEHHRRAEARHRRTEDSFGLASALGSYGTTLLMAGEHRQARTKLDESIDLAEQRLHGVFLTTGLRSRAMVRIRSGDLEGALADCDAAARRATQTGDGYNVAVTRTYAAEAHAERLRPGMADDLDHTIRTLEQRSAAADAANALSARALVVSLADRGAPPGVLEDLARALEHCSDVEFAYGTAWTSLRAADIHRWFGSSDAAVQHLRRCHDSAQRIGAAHLARRAAVDLALVDRAARWPQDAETDPATRWVTQLPQQSGVLGNQEVTSEDLSAVLLSITELTPLRRADVGCWLVKLFGWRTVADAVRAHADLDDTEMLTLAAHRHAAGADVDQEDAT